MLSLGEELNLRELCGEEKSTENVLIYKNIKRKVT